jgi:hypothetical protein
MSSILIRVAVDCLASNSKELVELLGRARFEVLVCDYAINEIAARLRRSKKTISTQTSNAMEKLNIDGDVRLVRYRIETGLVPFAARHPIDSRQRETSNRNSHYRTGPMDMNEDDL